MNLVVVVDVEVIPSPALLLSDQAQLRQLSLLRASELRTVNVHLVFTCTFYSQ